MVLIFFGISVFLSYILRELAASEGISENVLPQLMGYYYGYLNLSRWVLMVSTFLMPLYPMTFFVEKCLKGRLEPFIIRCRDKREWLKMVEQVFLLGVFLFFLLYLVPGFAMEMKKLFTSAYSKISLQFIALRFLELLVMAEFFLCIAFATKNATNAFWTLVFGYGTMNSTLISPRLNPFGISSYFRYGEWITKQPMELFAAFTLLIILWIIARFTYYRVGMR